MHSEADTAIWMPKERIVFTAASVGVKRFSNLRPSVRIADTLDAIKMMRALNPEIVVPGHGAPGAVTILDNMEKYYTLLLQRVGAMVKQGKSLDEIKKELKYLRDGGLGRSRSLLQQYRGGLSRGNREVNRAQFSLRRWNLGADPNFENTMEKAARINDRVSNDAVR